MNRLQIFQPHILPKAVVYLLILGAFSSPLFSQGQLFIEKPPFKRKLVQQGDSVRIRLKGSSSMLGFRYQGAKGDSIFLSGGGYQVDEFDRFWVHRPKISRYWLSMLVSSGLTMVVIFPPLMLLDAATRGTGVQRSDWRRIRNSIAAGLSIALFFRRLVWKRYKIGDKWVLKVRVPVEESVVPMQGGQPSSPTEDP